MASDRMSELFGPSVAASASEGKNKGGGVNSGDVEMQAVPDEGSSSYADVFSDIGEIKKMIVQINGAAEALLMNTQSYKTAKNQKVEAEIKVEHDGKHDGRWFISRQRSSRRFERGRKYTPCFM